MKPPRKPAPAAPPPPPPAQKVYEFAWDPAWGGKRVKEVLVELFPGLSSRERVLVVVNGLAEVGEETMTNLDSLMPEGGGLRVDLRHGVHGRGKPSRPRLVDQIKVLHDDEDVVVIVKAAGVIVAPTDDEEGRHSAPVIQLLQRYWKTRGEPEINPIVVHRLDKGTSGVMVLAKNMDAARALQRQASARVMERRYVALVEGRLRGERGTWDTFLGRGEDSMRQQIDGIERDENGHLPHGIQEAITHFTVADYAGPLTRLDLRLETGRTHQIRIHCAEAGHPVVGDPVYVKLARKRYPAQHFGEGPFAEPPRMFLHACYLKFQHPGGGNRWKTFRDEPPEVFDEFPRSIAENKQQWLRDKARRGRR